MGGGGDAAAAEGALAYIQLKADTAAIADVLRLAEGANGAMRQMLADGLPHLAPTKGEPRHAIQEQFSRLVTGTLFDLKETFAERQAAYQLSIQTCKEELAASEKAEELAAQEEEATSAAVSVKSQKLDVCRAALEKTNWERAVADFARDGFLKGCNELEAERSEISSVLDGPLRMLIEGGWGDEEVRDSVVGAVTTLLGSCQAEPALVAAAPKALALRPGGRAAFDELAAARVVEVLQERVASIDQQLQAKAHRRKDLVAEALGLFALSEREAEEEMTARVELADAKDALRRASRAREEAGANIGSRREALSAQLSGQVLEEEKAKQIDAALEAAERLAEFKYETAQRVADVSADASMAVEESAAATLPSKTTMAVPSGNPFGVPTPMFA